MHLCPGLRAETPLHAIRGVGAWNFFHIFQDPDDASVPGRLQDFQEEIILAT